MTGKERENRIKQLRAINVEGSEFEESIAGILRTMDTYYYCFGEAEDKKLFEVVENMLKDWVFKEWLDEGGDPEYYERASARLKKVNEEITNEQSE